MNKYSWLIGGEAGFGILTTGLTFSKIASRRGYEIFERLEYPSLIRGGHNAYEVTFGEEEIYDVNPTIDCLVCLNKETFDLHRDRLTSQSFIVFDQDEFSLDGNFVKINVPFDAIIKKLQGKDVMKNTISLGASLALLGGNLTELNSLIEEQFGKKGQEIVNFNKKFAEEGFNHVKNNYAKEIKDWLKPASTKAMVDEQKLVMTGNDAFSLAAVIADCRMYVSYPMTPSSSVLSTLAAWQTKNNMVVRHAEDEIAVINTAIGSSFVGVRSAVGTSGGGFALMVETVSLAGVTETPLVIFISQRPGPATGMPTWTEQGDLLFTVHSGHGEFPKIVLAPGGLEEMIELTVKAFDLADIYQTPVFIMSDMFLSENHRTIKKKFIDKFIKNYKPNRGKLVNQASTKYLRYKITDDGISERLIPGVKGVYYQANSYEHLEDGHTTESAEERIKQADKRKRKTITYLNNHFELPKVYGDLEKAELVFISWGSTKRPVFEAQRLLKEKGKETALIHFTHVFPLSEEKVKPLFKDGKRYILVENNGEGQFGKLLRQETGVEIKEKLLKYDGRMFTALEILKQLKD